MEKADMENTQEIMKYLHTKVDVMKWMVYPLPLWLPSGQNRRKSSL